MVSCYGVVFVILAKPHYHMVGFASTPPLLRRRRPYMILEGAYGQMLRTPMLIFLLLFSWSSPVDILNRRHTSRPLFTYFTRLPLSVVVSSPLTMDYWCACFPFRVGIRLFLSVDVFFSSRRDAYRLTTPMR